MKTYSIGRGEENDVVIRDHSVSQNHAELRVDGDSQFQLIDLAPTGKARPIPMGIEQFAAVRPWIG